MMDFKPLKKDGKRGTDGLFGWESPRLRQALKDEAKAKQPGSSVGLTPATARTIEDVNMVARDLGATALAEEGAPPREPGYGPWIRWNFDMDNIPRGAGRIWIDAIYSWKHCGYGELSGWCWTDHDPSDNIQWYCHKDPQ